MGGDLWADARRLVIVAVWARFGMPMRLLRPITALRLKFVPNSELSASAIMLRLNAVASSFRKRASIASVQKNFFNTPSPL
jgi:hypothetical protein